MTDERHDQTPESGDRDRVPSSRPTRLSSSDVVWIGVAVVALLIIAMLVVVALQ
ncbi:MAG: hypothetical protein ACTHMZ_03890 [Actinomycetes bacterium]